MYIDSVYMKRWCNCTGTWPDPRNAYFFSYDSAHSFEVFAMLGNFACCFFLHFFSKVRFFKNETLSGIRSVCQTVLIKIMPDMDMSVSKPFVKFIRSQQQQTNI